MKPFNISEWLQDKSRKVVTRDGRVVKILDTEFESGNGNKSVLAKCIYNNKAAVYVYTTDGKVNNISETENDLFFADEEGDELTEFNDECYDFTFELIQNNKKQLGLDDNYIGAPKVIQDLCMICCQYGYNKAKEETK